MAQGQRPFYLVLGAILIAAVAFLIYRSSQSTPISIPANAAILPADTAGFRGYLLGSDSAPVEVSEYADFECPHCAVFTQVQLPDIKTRLLDTGKARWRWRDFPLEGHLNSRSAAHAAACANDQGHFWDVTERLFDRQNDWALRKDPVPIYTEVITAAGLDKAKWMDCMKTAKYAGRIQASYQEGVSLGVNSTPTFLINNQLYSNIGSADQIVHIVDSLTALATPKSATPKTP